MSDLPTDKLTAAKATLAELREPRIQAALQKLMSAELGIVEEFSRLVDEQAEIAKRILLSSVSWLVKLHVVDNLTAELKRRAEGN